RSVDGAGARAAGATEDDAGGHGRVAHGRRPSLVRRVLRVLAPVKLSNRTLTPRREVTSRTGRRAGPRGPRRGAARRGGGRSRGTPPAPARCRPRPSGW